MTSRRSFDDRRDGTLEARRAEYAAEGQQHAGGGDTAQWGPDMAFYKLTQGPDAGGCFVSLISG